VTEVDDAMVAGEVSLRAVRKKWSDDTWQPLARRSIVAMIARRDERDRWWLLVRDTLVAVRSLKM
jgi:hypothetical protein